MYLKIYGLDSIIYTRTIYEDFRGPSPRWVIPIREEL